MVELTKTINCQAKAGAEDLFSFESIFFHFTESFSKLKRNMNTFIRIFIRNKPVLALKISKRGLGVYFWTPCYGYALNCLFVYLSIQGTHPLFERKQKLFISITCILEK